MKAVITAKIDIMVVCNETRKIDIMVECNETLWTSFHRRVRRSDSGMQELNRDVSKHSNFIYRSTIYIQEIPLSIPKSVSIASVQ